MAGGLAFVAGPARADAIDGDWCRETANFSIRGPAIRTPGGAEITGEYDRHGFAYVVPPGEAGAGGRIVMSLVSDDALNLIPPGATHPEMWHRCKPIS